MYYTVHQNTLYPVKNCISVIKSNLDTRKVYYGTSQTAITHQGVSRHDVVISSTSQQ